MNHDFSKIGRNIMVYNVGVNFDFDFVNNTVPIENVRKQYDINTIGCVWCTLECAPIMAEQEKGGAIVNVSSISSEQNRTGINVGYAFYAMSKAAMNKWGELSAAHYAPMGVRINTLVLGPVASVMVWRAYRNSRAANPQKERLQDMTFASR